MESFCCAARQGKTVPVWADIRGSDPDPVSAFQRIRGDGASFIMEEADSKGRIRRSLMGSHPWLLATFYSGRVEVMEEARSRTSFRCAHPVEGLRHVVSGLGPATSRRTLTGCVGLTGYFHYEVVRHWERVVGMAPEAPDDVEGRFFMPGRLVEYDHVSGGVRAWVLVRTDDCSSLRKAYDSGMEQLDIMARALTSREPSPATSTGFTIGALKTDFPKERFEAAVKAARCLIRNGDAIQVVLSRRLTGRARGDDMVFYRNLRAVNPSPYLFYLSFGETRLVGASPEMLVRLEGRCITYKPIAGTKPRGGTPEEDLSLEYELRQDPKERAEHVMLVDLGRNDVGRVAVPGSVRVTRFMEVERFSHVMHLVSRIEAELEDGKDGLDLLMSVFPAGTVTGAPKIRAMEIIAGLEPGPRGSYAGAVGFVGGNGDVDFCIPIRTAFLQGDQIRLQAGAGIVYDSVPEREFQETVYKVQALMGALKRSEAA